MSLYRELRQNPPKLNIEGRPDKILIDMVSVMCDNRSQIVITKKENGDYSFHAKLRSGMGYSFSNYQTGHSKEDIKWEMDSANWEEVLKMINNGTAAIENIKCR